MRKFTERCGKGQDYVIIDMVVRPPTLETKVRLMLEHIARKVRRETSKEKNK